MSPRILIASTLLLSLQACHFSRDNDSGRYFPGLGEIMSMTALRHAKLWFAGDAENWPLAAYELDEIREGLEDAARFHPQHKAIKKPIPLLIETTTGNALVALDQSIQRRDRKTFQANFDKLTAACNACHSETDFGFNIVTRPAFNPFPSQSFSALK